MSTTTDNLSQTARRALIKLCNDIGGVADSTERVVATWSHLLCSPDANCRNHAETIATALSSFGEVLRKTIDTTNELGDDVSVQLFTEISEDVYEWHQKMTA